MTAPLAEDLVATIRRTAVEADTDEQLVELLLPALLATLAGPIGARRLKALLDQELAVDPPAPQPLRLVKSPATAQVIDIHRIPQRAASPVPVRVPVPEVHPDPFPARAMSGAEFVDGIHAAIPDAFSDLVDVLPTSAPPPPAPIPAATRYCWRVATCGRLAVGERWDGVAGDWKPVCEMHRVGAAPMELRALPRSAK